MNDTFDKNQAIGLALFAVILLAYLYFAPKAEPPKPPVAARPKTAPAPSASATRPPSLSEGGQGVVPAADSLTQARNQAQFGPFAAAATGAATDIILENQDVKLTLSTRGGKVKAVELKGYKTFDKKPLILLDENTNTLALEVATPQGQLDIYKLYFATAAPARTVASADTARVAFRLEVAPGQYVQQTYSLPAKGYQVNYDVQLVGLDNALKNQPARFFWEDNLRKLEMDMTLSRQAATVNYYLASGSFEQLTETSLDRQERKIEEPIHWVNLKQKYFSAAIIAKGTSFGGGRVQSVANEADPTVVKTVTADLTLPLADLKAGKGQFQFFFGPNNYQIVKKVTAGFGDNVYLGWPVIRWVNQFVTVPVFNFLARFIGNYGIIILVLVLLVKLVLTPLTYRSYISAAKMRVLQPEIKVIKEAAGEDTAKFQQDQMKLYQQVGVSPLSGCIPVLLTMPILFAMFSFFPSAIELRQQPFLWSNDLSVYDSVLNLPFKIPFYGSHVSLFAIFMTISSVAFAYYNNQMTTVEGPIKTLGYVMPVVFLFVMNSFPAGLSFYYFVSNVVTIAQQQLIRRFVNEDKIKSVLEKNRETAHVRKKSKFQQRIEDAMKSAEEAKKVTETTKRKK